MRPFRALVRITLWLCVATILRMVLGFAWLRAKRTSQKRFASGRTEGLCILSNVQTVMGLRVTWEGQFPDEPAVLMEITVPTWMQCSSLGFGGLRGTS